MSIKKVKPSKKSVSGNDGIKKAQDNGVLFGKRSTKTSKRSVYDNPLFFLVLFIIVLAVALMLNEQVFERTKPLGFDMIPKTMSNEPSMNEASLLDKISSNDLVMNRGSGLIPYMQSYFLDKKLVIRIPEHEIQLKKYWSIIAEWVLPEDDIVYGRTDEVFTQNIHDYLLTQENYQYNYISKDNIVNDNVYWIIGENWVGSNRIILISAGDSIFFCPEETFDEIQDMVRTGQALTLSDPYQPPAFETGIHMLPITVVENIESNALNTNWQVYALLAILLFGLILTFALIGSERPMLSCSIAFPVGAACVCLLILLLQILCVPYSLLSIVLAVVAAASIAMPSFIRAIKRNPKILKRILLTVMVSMFLFGFFVRLQSYTLYTDGQSSLQISMRLARFGYILDLLEKVSPYGIFTSFINSLGYLVGADMFFAVYPAICTSIIASIGSFLYTICENSARWLRCTVSVLGMLTYFLCEEIYRFHALWFGNNLMTSACLLLFTISIMLHARTKNNGYLVIALIGTLITIATRVEGAVYISFMMVASLQLEADEKAWRGFTFAVSGAIIVWNLLHFILLGFDYSSLFWTSSRGYLVCALALALNFAQPTINMNNPVCRLAKKRFPLVMTGAVLIVAALCSIIKWNIATQNFDVIMYHMTSSFEVGVWLFALILLPLGAISADKEAKYGASLVACYLLMIFVIFLFRSDLALRYGVGDSGRRTISQALPLASMFSALAIDRILSKVFKKTTKE